MTYGRNFIPAVLLSGGDVSVVAVVGELRWTLVIYSSNLERHAQLESF